MSSGYCAAYADVLSVDGLKKLCPKAYAQFLIAMASCNKSLNDVAFEVALQDELDEIIQTRLTQLCKAFKKKTGLALNLGYHSRGDCYDDVSGAYWYVDGMYHMTAKGKKISEYVERATWVQYG